MNRSILTLFAALVLAGCSSCTPVPPPSPAPAPIPSPEPPPDPPPQPAPDPTASDLTRACDRLRQLGCRGGVTTAKGASCETVLQETQASGVVALDLECLAHLTSCSGEPACSRAP